MAEQEPTVELQCPVCGEPQELPEEERDGESEWSLNPCDTCAEEGTPAQSIPGFPGIDLQDGEIVCEAHGLQECPQDPCADLVWPDWSDISHSATTTAISEDQ